MKTATPATAAANPTAGARRSEFTEAFVGGDPPRRGNVPVQRLDRDSPWQTRQAPATTGRCHGHGHGSPQESIPKPMPPTRTPSGRLAGARSVDAPPDFLPGRKRGHGWGIPEAGPQSGIPRRGCVGEFIKEGRSTAAPGMRLLAAGLLRLPRIHRHHGTMSMSILRTPLRRRSGWRDPWTANLGTGSLVGVPYVTRVTGGRVPADGCRWSSCRRVIRGEGDNRSGNEGGSKRQFHCVHRFDARYGLDLVCGGNRSCPSPPLTPHAAFTPQSFFKNRGIASISRIGGQFLESVQLEGCTTTTRS